jgi:hypothetical protein
VRSGRLRAFSVVPALVGQRKVGASDVGDGVGSQWRDELWDGVLGKERKQGKQGRKVSDEDGR